MPPIITIAPGPKLRDGEVAIWERHVDHPDGEVFLAHGDAPIQAARTSLVSERLSKGRLREVEQAAEPEAAASAPESKAPEPAPPDAPSASPPADASAAPATATDPLDAPGLLTEAQRKSLADAGIVTAADVRAVDDAALATVDGIGPATIARLREATKE